MVSLRSLGRYCWPYRMVDMGWGGEEYYNPAWRCLDHVPPAIRSAREHLAKLVDERGPKMLKSA